MEEVLKTTREAIQRKTLYRCLTCEAIMEYQLHEEWFQKGGSLYNLAVKTHGKLKLDKKYSFPQQGTDQDALYSPWMESSTTISLIMNLDHYFTLLSCKSNFQSALKINIHVIFMVFKNPSKGNDSIFFVYEFRRAVFW